MTKSPSKGWVKAGEYGGYIDKNDGLYTYWIYPWYARWFLLTPVKFLQKTLWLCGVAIHDPVFGECTPDFNCCNKVGRKAFIRISEFES